MMEKKVVYRISTIADYDREALYLGDMHAKGWKLKEVSYSIIIRNGKNSINNFLFHHPSSRLFL